jgi:type I restriction enzyme, R subunit
LSVKVSELSFEETIERALIARDHEQHDPAVIYGAVLEGLAGGYHRRELEEYDRKLCLIPRDVLDFIYATQPKEWTRLKQHHGVEVKERFLLRLAREIESRGALDVLHQRFRLQVQPRVLSTFKRTERRVEESLRRQHLQRSSPALLQLEE